MATDEIGRNHPKKLKLATVVALNPWDFPLDSITAPDGSAWRLFGEDFPTNPRFLVTGEGWAMWRLWCQTRGGFGGLGHLPEAGGILDQAAITMEALDEITAAKAWCDENCPPPPKKPRRQ